MDSGEFRARAYATVQLAADGFPDRDKLPFPLEKTTEVLRIFASVMAPEAGLAPNAFRRRFFRDSFDPVDAWAIQPIMRDVAAADTRAGVTAGAGGGRCRVLFHPRRANPARAAGTGRAAACASGRVGRLMDAMQSPSQRPAPARPPGGG